MSTNETQPIDSDGVECPTCGDTFSEERFMKSHHKQVHDSYVKPNEELIQEINRVAEKIGETPTRSDMEEYIDFSFDLYHQRFDSWNAAVKRAGLPVNLRRDIPRSKLLSELERLGEELGRTPKRKDMEKQGEFAASTYSNEFGSWNSGLREAGFDPNVRVGESETVECEGCGESITRSPYEIEQRDSHYCSQDCMLEHRSGKNHPRWNGGKVNYGPGWHYRKREKVRDRDGRRCVSCKMPETEHLEEYGTRLHVHHIKKAREFDDPEERNAMENLKTLCITCHNEQDWG